MPPRVLTLIFQWFPLVALPLMLAQLYSTAGMAWTPASFSGASARRPTRTGTPPAHTVDLSYPYFVDLHPRRERRQRARPGLLRGRLRAGRRRALERARARALAARRGARSSLAVAVVGWGGHVGLHRAQRVIESAALEWLADWLRRDTDPFRSSTALGSIGRLKLSDRIVLRVSPGPGVTTPLLLREASYNAFSMPDLARGGRGLLRRCSPRPTAPPGSWARASPPETQVTVSAPLRRGRGVLPLPGGAFEIDRLSRSCAWSGTGSAR